VTKRASKITIEWSVADVKCSRPQLTMEQCKDVLEVIESDHDAQVGINWGVVKDCADELFPMDYDTKEQVEVFDGHRHIGANFNAIQKEWDLFQNRHPAILAYDEKLKRGQA
jgi:hypothetical protein